MNIVRGMDTYFTRRYVCACCWGDLGVEAFGDPEVHYCLKGPERCSGNGFVTRRYAARRLEESHYELAEVRRNYPDIEPRIVVQLNEAQLLKALGF